MKDDEINAMSERIQTYNQTASTATCKQNRQELIETYVFDKADKAVKEVGAEKGLVYVFDMSSRVILYNSKESMSISFLLLRLNWEYNNIVN